MAVDPSAVGIEMPRGEVDQRAAAALAVERELCFFTARQSLCQPPNLRIPISDVRRPHAISS
jgi:hypothetical protein